MKRIRSFFLLAVLAAAASNLSAQSKMVRLHLADGTSKYTSVAGLEKISFLAPDVADRGLTLNLADGSRVGVYFCDEPAITFTDGGFRLSSAALDPVEVSFDNVSDITVGTVAAVESVGSENLMIICELNPGEVLFRGLPAGVAAEVYSIDGRLETSVAAASGEVSLSRDAFASGVHIVKIGSYTAKIIF